MRCSFGRRWRLKVSPNAESLRRKVSVCCSTDELMGYDRLPNEPEADGLRGRISRERVFGCAIRFNGRGGALEAAGKGRLVRSSSCERRRTSSRPSDDRLVENVLHRLWSAWACQPDIPDQRKSDHSS